MHAVAMPFNLLTVPARLLCLKGEEDTRKKVTSLDVLWFVSCLDVNLKLAIYTILFTFSVCLTNLVKNIFFVNSETL